MKLHEVFKPTWSRAIVFLLLAAYFLSVKSHGFYQGDYVDPKFRRSDITVVGYPYSYYTTSPSGSTNFSTRNFLKNILVFYVLACILVVWGLFFFNIFRGRDTKLKTFTVGMAIYGAIGLAVLIKVFGGDWLYRAAIGESKKSIELLLLIGVDVDSSTSDGNASPLFVAAQKNNLQMAQLFLNAGSDPNRRNKDGLTALHVAARNNASEIIQTLIVAGANVALSDYEKNTALHYAKSYPAAEALVKANASVLVLNKKGYPPLFYANDEKTLKLLLDNGAKLTTSSEDGTQLIDLATDPGVITHLVNTGASVNHKNPNGDTLLLRIMKAETKKDSSALDTIKLLLTRGASVDIRDKQEFSALHYALRQCDVEAGKLLLPASTEAKAHLSVKNPKGKLKHIIEGNADCWEKVKVGFKPPQVSSKALVSLENYDPEKDSEPKDEEVEVSPVEQGKDKGESKAKQSAKKQGGNPDISGAVKTTPTPNPLEKPKLIDKLTIDGEITDPIKPAAEIKKTEKPGITIIIDKKANPETKPPPTPISPVKTKANTKADSTATEENETE